MDRLFSNDYLVHYGVKGMKWGVRRYQPYSTHPRKSGKGGIEIGTATKKGKSAANQVLSKHGDISPFSHSFKSAIIAEAIQNGSVTTEMNPEKQGRHLKGSSLYISGRSYIDADEETVRKEIERLCLTGEAIGQDNASWKRKELVVSSRLIGIIVDPDTGDESTSCAFTLHYSKTGTHLVPRKEG